MDDMQEIERKFLVNSMAFKNQAFAVRAIKQGFLNTDPQRTVRIRISGEEAFITVKGKSGDAGVSRFEWEQEIPVDQAKALYALCEPGKIDKTRYLVRSGRHVVEVDEFHQNNQGLLIAEIELASREEPFQRPSWLGEEVTGQSKYYNSQLSKHPFKDWQE